MWALIYKNPKAGGLFFLLGLVLLVSFSTSLSAQNQDEYNLANEYFNDGEYEKALELYQKLFKANNQVDFYAYRVVECYLLTRRAEEAMEFVERIAQKNPQKVQYEALKGKILERTGKMQQAEALWNDLIQNKLQTINDFSNAGNFFMIYQNYAWAKKTYLQARQVLKNPTLFNGDLASIFQVTNEIEAATQEYLSMYLQNPAQASYVKSQILRLAKEEYADQVERPLVAFLQKNPSNVDVREMLYEVYLQLNNFEEAFIQCRSLDKLKKEGGTGIFKLAQTLQQNKEYELSNQALDYILNNYEGTALYLEAYFEKVKNFELKASESRPLDTTSIRKAVENYDALFKKFGRNENLYEAMYRKARLCVFYLNDLKSAIDELQEIDKLALPLIKKANAKLLMGDVYLLQGDYTKAKLKYHEIEEQFKDTQVGAMAKFKAAQLAYYKGDFELAKSSLRILKENTTSDISNDAIRLFLIIQDNIGLDTTTTALERFAHAQLLSYQKNYRAAVELLDSILYAFPNHELADDIYWEKANIYLNQNNPDKALFWLDKILENHKDGIYADDALFTKAEIYEIALGDKEKAQQLYLQLLLDFPASLYKVEARKRIRKLKGQNPGS
ncbi:MAG: tetratricopeptide repeat protein [Bacteroidia bacterium]|nr:tetratricopeptide repeat protein [Bacteroidia bacterium]MDW8157479.1 tetratricopeptide repeat protein [Bacteroidia bacterium]